MKIKLSITLSEELMIEMDKLVPQYGNRSAVIEQAIHTFLASGVRNLRDDSDLEILNRQADTINVEAEDVLSYQVK